MRRSFPLFVILLSWSALAGAHDNATEQTTRARREIQSLLERMAAAEKAGDVAALSQCFEGDGMLLPSSGEPIKGRENISRRYQAIFAGKTPRLPLESEELWVVDDLAVSRGATRGPAPRRSVKGPVRNRYVMTLRRHGDSWEIHSLIWNSVATGK